MTVQLHLSYALLDLPAQPSHLPNLTHRAAKPKSKPVRVISSRKASLLLFAARLVSTYYNIIHDCDEVFNYWEPLHYLLYGYGLQTWEYRYKSSPAIGMFIAQRLTASTSQSTTRDLYVQSTMDSTWHVPKQACAKAQPAVYVCRARRVTACMNPNTTCSLYVQSTKQCKWHVSMHVPEHVLHFTQPKHKQLERCMCQCIHVPQHDLLFARSKQKESNNA